jgi:hypothetical protein
MWKQSGIEHDFVDGKSHCVFVVKAYTSLEKTHVSADFLSCTSSKVFSIIQYVNMNY